VSWRLRPLERRDLAEALEIERTRFDEPWTRGMLLDELGQPETRYYLAAVEGGRLIGYAGVMIVLGEAHVNTIGVSAEVEGRGVATDLLRAVLVEARRRGATRATLEVAVSNERARALYQRFGFAPVGVRRRYYERRGEDALVMWADLPDEEPAPPTLT
jgi:ribosomal-protein-alanine N-acetyltransferase